MASGLYTQNFFSLRIVVSAYLVLIKKEAKILDAWRKIKWNTKQKKVPLIKTRMKHIPLYKLRYFYPLALCQDSVSCHILARTGRLFLNILSTQATPLSSWGSKEACQWVWWAVVRPGRQNHSCCWRQFSLCSDNDLFDRLHSGKPGVKHCIGIW